MVRYAITFEKSTQLKIIFLDHIQTYMNEN